VPQRYSPAFVEALVITRALGAALLASIVALGVQTWRLDMATDTLAEERRVAAEQLAFAEQQARAQEQEFAANARKAAQIYATQSTRVRADADSARDELDRLRDTLGASVPNAAEGAASAARADVAARLVVVVNECAAAIQTMAGAADRTAAQLEALQAYVNGLTKD
jgi:hypothetical protein